MVKFDGQRVGRTVMSLGGNGVGQVLVAVAAAFLVRHLSGPEPALPSEYDVELEDGEKEDGDIEVGEEAPVSGKVTPVTIRWCNISCFLSDKSSKSVRWLLKNVSGEAKPGRLLAIMGPSGSGKTTLLNILAGQLAASPRLHLSGLIDFNGKTDSNKRAYRLAYVRQEDLFFSQLTVRETLKLAAELQVTEISSVEEREEYVNSLLLKLGLVNCAESCVGDARVRGISGGEKKRLSLACELIASPSVIFADEPTTGLDAFQAEKVVETLKQLAKDGHTVICSIHQPRGSVYSKFDDIVLLTEGALVYAGPAHEEPLEYFSKFGYNCPDHVNPAEFLADLISIDYSSADSVYSSQKRIYGLVESFSRYSSTILYAIPIEKRQVLAGKKSRKSKLLKKGGWWRQFCLLLKRAWMQASRDGPTNKVRARMSIASAIIFGSVFWRMGRSQTSIQDRMGLLQVAAINTAMAALTKTVGVFPKERAIVDRERAKGSYTLGPYLLSKLLAEIPIGAAFPLIFGAILYPMARLHPTVSRFGKFCSIVTVESFAASAMGLTVGAMVPSTEAAMAVGPSLMTVFIVFGGYYVNADNTPIIFRWIPSVSLIRWAFQGLCVNEFKGLQFDCQHSFDIQTGEQALERLSFGQSRIGGTLMAQSRILLFWYYTAYLLLEKNKPKYQQLEPPPLDETQPDDLQIETFDNDNLHKTEREGDLQIETFDNDNLHKTEREGDLQIETFDNDNLHKTEREGDLQIETFDHDNLHKTEREGDLQIGTFDNDNLDKSQPERELQMKTFDNDNLDKSQPEGDLQMKTFDNDNLDKSQPEGDLQMKTFDNDNLDKSQPEGDLQMKTFDNENLNKTQLEGDLQIESFDNDDMEKPPSLEQVESKDADIETPEIDQIRPFILEGAK